MLSPAGFLVTVWLLAAILAIPSLGAPPKPTGLQEVVILGINDIHGALAPARLKSVEIEGTTPVAYTVGGAPMLAAYIERARVHFGKNLLVLDAGDQWQGTMESNLQKGRSVVRFFNLIGVDAATIGNHEFDFGGEKDPSDLRGALRARLNEANYPYVSANIIEEATGKGLKINNLYPHTILRAGELKVGIVGLTTESTPITTARKNIIGLKFASLIDTTVRQAREVRAAGADIVVLVAHAGAICEELERGQHSSHCNPADEMVRLLEGIPAGTLDAVVSGHTHSLLHQQINGVPVVQAGKSGAFFNLIHLNYDWSLHRLRPELSVIEGPVPVCEKVFANQGDCNGKRSAGEEGRGPLVSPAFLGSVISPDSKTLSLLEEVEKEIGGIRVQPLGQAAQPIPHLRFEESPMGNLVADAVRAKSGADFAFLNAGGIRDSLESGTITRGDVFRIMPFDNYVSELKVTGRELKEILSTAQGGKYGVFPISGLVIKLDAATQGPERLLEVKTTDGKEIENEKWYRLATCDFLVTGGDGMGAVMKKIPAIRIELMAGGATIREALEEYVTKLRVVNPIASPLRDPSKPRIIFIHQQLSSR